MADGVESVYDVASTMATQSYPAGPEIESLEEEQCPQTSSISVVVLHGDHLTSRRGRTVARSIAREMGMDGRLETALWNVQLLGTLYGRAASLEASRADVVILALRSPTEFSLDLKTWLRRWLVEKRNDPVAFIAIFEDTAEPETADVRRFLEHAAQSAGKECFCQSATGEPLTSYEMVWVL